MARGSWYNRSKLVNYKKDVFMDIPGLKEMSSTHIAM